MWDIWGSTFQQSLVDAATPLLQGAGAALGIETQLDADIAVDQAIAASRETREAIRAAGSVANYFEQGAGGDVELVPLAAEIPQVVEPAAQAGQVAGETLVSMLHDLPEVGGSGLVGTFDLNDAEDLTELVGVMRNASVIPLAPPAPANEGFLAELDEAEEVVEDFVPTFVRQGAEWAERQTVMLSDFVGSQNLSSRRLPFPSSRQPPVPPP